MYGFKWCFKIRNQTNEGNNIEFSREFKYGEILTSAECTRNLVCGFSCALPVMTKEMEKHEKYWQKTENK